MQNLFDRNESHRKLIERLSQNFDKKLGQESEIERLKVQVSQLREKLDKF